MQILTCLTANILCVIFITKAALTVGNSPNFNTKLFPSNTGNHTTKFKRVYSEMKITDIRMMLMNSFARKKKKVTHLVL